MTEYDLMNKNLKKLIASSLLVLLCSSVPVSVLRASETRDQSDGFTSILQEKTGGGYAASGQIEGAGFTTVLYDESNGLPTSDSNYLLY